MFTTPEDEFLTLSLKSIQWFRRYFLKRLTNSSTHTEKNIIGHVWPFSSSEKCGGVLKTVYLYEGLKIRVVSSVIKVSNGAVNDLTASLILIQILVLVFVLFDFPMRIFG